MNYQAIEQQTNVMRVTSRRMDQLIQSIRTITGLEGKAYCDEYDRLNALLLSADAENRAAFQTRETLLGTNY